MCSYSLVMELSSFINLFITLLLLIIVFLLFFPSILPSTGRILLIFHLIDGVDEVSSKSLFALISKFPRRNSQRACFQTFC